MNDFITKYQNELTGTLSGFDRLVFRGTLWRNRVSAMKGYLWAHHLGSKDFGEHAEQISKRVKEAATQPILAAGRPVRYLNSGKDDKQEIACRSPRPTTAPPDEDVPYHDLYWFNGGDSDRVTPLSNIPEPR